MGDDVQPRVTVLMPVHNGAAFLPEALESIRRQSYRDFELLVVDDGSIDATPEILAGWRDPRLRVLTNETQHGLSRSLNRGLLAARGELVARMDGDDIALPQRLARQVDFLDAHPEVALVGTNVQPVDTAGRHRGRPAGALPRLPGHVSWLLPFGNCINHPTVMARRAVLQGVGGYDPTAFPSDDYDLWLRLSARHRLANLSDVLLHYRQHPTSVSAVHSDSADKQANVAAVALAQRLDADVSPRWLRVLQAPDRLDPGDLTADDARRACRLLRQATVHHLRSARLTPDERTAVLAGEARLVARLLRAARDRPALALSIAATGLRPRHVRVARDVVRGAPLLRGVTWPPG